MTTSPSPGPARRTAAQFLGGRTAAQLLGGRTTQARPSGALMLLLIVFGLTLACTVLYVARPVLMPLAIAGLLQFLLAPIVRRMRGLGLPGPLAAGVLILTFLGLVGSAVYHLSTPAAKWIGELQDNLWLIESRFSDLKQPLEGVARASKRVEELAAVDAQDDPEVVRVRPETGRSVQSLIARAFEFIVTVLLVVFLLFFLLARDGVLLRKIPALVRDPELRDRLGEVFQKVEREISTYLLTISAINAVLGIAVGTAMYLYNVPNPLLWGVMACLLNFVPYLGGLVGVGVILVVSLLSDQVAYPFLPPLTYVLLNGLEGMVITPLILGRMLTLSPVAVFLWLILSGWLWGVPGALLAVPLLAVAKMVCDKVPSLHPVARLLDR